MANSACDKSAGKPPAVIAVQHRAPLASNEADMATKPAFPAFSWVRTRRSNRILPLFQQEISERSMSIFETIRSKLSGKTPVTPAATAPAAPSEKATATRTAAPSAPAPASPPGQPVDLPALLDALCGKRSEKLNEKLEWRNSTADLMRVLSVDNSVQARQELAKELQYDGDIKNTAATDCWLHGQIMAILAANGGKLPNELRRRWYLSHYGP